MESIGAGPVTAPNNTDKLARTRGSGGKTLLVAPSESSSQDASLDDLSLTRDGDHVLLMQRALSHHASITN